MELHLYLEALIPQDSKTWVSFLPVRPREHPMLTLPVRPREHEPNSAWHVLFKF